MGNLIVVLVILGILGCAIGYIVRAKKQGVTCIGCSCGGSCGGHCGSNDSSTECSCGESCDSN